MSQGAITARVGKGEDNTARNALICQMRRDGVGPREIARRLGLTPGVVLGALHRAGLTDTDRPQGVRGQAVRELVVASELSATELKRVWGVDYATSRKWRLVSLQPASGEG